ncbi:MAG: D-alanyl-D-alanine endopeptidase [Undibacterium sp.]|uniref:D-alanyl-D-alanine endopeptidase n=1 Tax=Undibacterium sp. TaxID=1914977 RepID=UPI00271B8FC9|nr:D-alanyl-D-alanine endopeptidase [Undibacterium sp.]MDO8651792.1 D-alanyl-D-alanine endopeptidase [Undibacterium sp.]
MVKFFRHTLFIFAAAILPVTLAQAATPAQKKHSAKKHLLHKKIIGKSATGHLVKHTIVVNGKRRVIIDRAAFAPVVIENLSAGDIAGLKHTQDPLALQSNVAYVVDQASSKVLFEKNSNVSLPIASITKLMTSLVVVESNQDMNEIIEVTTDDLDKEKGTGSRLQMGAKLSRADMLHIALMSSENRAASALGRSYIGGLPAFVAAMNAKAKQLGMTDTHYVDSSGLSSHNVASARDLVKLIIAAYQHPRIREYSTDSRYVVNPSGRPLQYSTTNKLVASPGWDIGLQKTGYIAEAGRCLVMQAMIEGRAIVMVFLDSKGKYSRLADAGRIRKWLETLKPQA